MTGYGSGTAAYVREDGALVPDAVVEVRIRTLNHRFLDVRLRLPPALQDHGALIEETLRKRLQRGRVELTVRIDGNVAAPPVLDIERAKVAYAQLCSLRDEIAPDDSVPLDLLTTVPELFNTDVDSGQALGKEAVLEALTKACDEVDAMRLREGRSSARDLSARLERIRAKITQVRLQTPTLVENYRSRLRERIDKLLQDRIGIDQVRLEHEVALFADRTDVAEELSRLGSHCDQFDEIMQGTGPTHGRKLDFLLQEMGREVNTIGAKVQEPDVTRMVVELKADLERMREQVQNVM